MKDGVYNRIDEIYTSIVEASDTELQKKIWLNENNDTGRMSSYIELMCSLFNDMRFSQFIDLDARKEGLSDSIITELDKLRYELNNYKEKDTEAEIISDENWQLVVLQAQKVLRYWKHDINT